MLLNASPKKELRDVGDEMLQKVSAAGTALSLNPDVYKALQAVDATKADAATRYFLEHTLLEYGLSGIDKDAATRERVRKLSDELTGESLQFQRNIAESQGKVVVKSAAELDGLPADYIARHKPGADGTNTLTTEQPDTAGDDVCEERGPAEADVPGVQWARLPGEQAVLKHLWKTRRNWPRRWAMRTVRTWPRQTS